MTPRPEPAAPAEPVRSSDPRPGAKARLWVAYLLLGALLIVGYALAPDRTMQNALYSVLTLLAVTAILVGIRVRRPVSRAPWLLFAAGQLLWALGDAVEVGYEQLGRELPYPSWADVAYLAAYPVLALGLGLMIISRDRRPDRTRMLDALIVTTGLSLVVWLLIIAPILVTESGSGSAVVVSVAYPVGDLVLLAAVVVLGTSAAGHTISVRLLLAALICVVVADTLYSAVPGSSADALGPSDDRWLEYLWMGSYLFWGASALHPSMTALFLPPSQRQAGPSLTRLLAVAGACALAPLVLVLERGSDLSPAIWGLAWGTMVILLLVVFRLWISIGHLSSLTEQRDLFQQELIFLSTRDPLTGLPNRDEGMLHLRVTLGQGSEKDVGPAVLVVDLDHLGRINERYGREAGDEVLRALAIRLSEELGTEGTLSRLGGGSAVDVRQSAAWRTHGTTVGRVDRYPLLRLKHGCQVGAAAHEDERRVIITTLTRTPHRHGSHVLARVHATCHRWCPTPLHIREQDTRAGRAHRHGVLVVRVLGLPREVDPLAHAQVGGSVGAAVVIRSRADPAKTVAAKPSTATSPSWTTRTQTPETLHANAIGHRDLEWQPV